MDHPHENGDIPTDGIPSAKKTQTRFTKIFDLISMYGVEHTDNVKHSVEQINKI